LAIKSILLKHLIFLSFLLIFSGCNNKYSNENNKQITQGEPVEIKYAKGFSIEKFDGFTIITVRNPWPGAGQNFRYLLIKKGIEVPSGLEYDQKTEVPVKKMVVTSTTHIPALEALNEENSLSGFPGLDYISSKKTRQLIEKGEITELGINENINTEFLINLSPDVVIGFAINGNNKAFETIKKTGIPVMFNGDWTEESPLGKAEWIKFFGAFFEKNDQARKIFNKIDASYSKAKALAGTSKDTPTVLSGSMYRDQWYLPHGNSWQARFIKDANGEYIYNESRGEGSKALSFESVLSDARNADLWLSSAQIGSYEQLLNKTQHYNQFQAVKNKHVYTFSTTTGETGGVLFFELGPHRPDLVLKDLISIFHPDLLPEYNTTFYKALK